MPIVYPKQVSPQNRRSNKRVQHKALIVVRFQNVNKQSVSEQTHTMVVSDHGALILLEAAVNPRQIIRLEKLSVREELLCRVVGLGPTILGKTQVAVEFIVPQPGFWGA